MNIITDIRLDILRIHVGLRLYLNPTSWKFGLPYKPRKWWINPFFGPIELTLFVGKSADLLDFSTSIDFEWGPKDGRSRGYANINSYRLHPCHYEYTFEEDNRFGGYWSSRWLGPIWIYKRRWRN